MNIQPTGAKGIVKKNKVHFKYGLDHFSVVVMVGKEEQDF